MKRGPKKPTAAQGNFLADQATRRPTVQPVQSAAKPNPFSASGTSTAPAASTGIGQSSSGASPIPSPSTGAISTPASLGQVPSASGQMKGGGSVKKYASGGATETNQYGSWGGANATDAVSANPASYTGTPSYTSPTTPTSGPFSTTPGTSPLNQSSPGIPSNYTSALAGYKSGTGNAYGMADSQKWLQNMATPGYSQHQYDPTNLAQWDQLSPGQQAYIGYTNKDYGGVEGQVSYLTAAKGGSIPALDDGGEVEDPGGVDMGQGQEGQAGDLSGALDAVQQAYQYGLQQITGNIPTVPAGPGGDQTQGGPQDRGNQLAANIPTVPAGPGGDQPNPNPFPTKTAPIPFGKQAEGADYTAAVARGGSVPSLDAGGVMPPPAAPQPQQPASAPAGGGVQGNQPPQLIRYLTGADAAPIPRVLRTMQTMQGHGRAARAVASGQTPQQKYAILQALRRLSDNAGTHAKVSLTGNGKIPASLPHAVMFANKKFEYQPTPYHVSFALKGKGKPTNKAARGGAIQAFGDGGDVGPDQNPDPISQMAGAGAPITMNVSDLQTGQTQNQDITPAQLQSLASGTFDSYVSQPAQTLAQAISRVAQAGMAVPQTGNARSLPDVAQQAQEQSEFSPGAGYPETPNVGKLQPENYYEQGPQSNVRPGTQGGFPAQTSMPYVSVNEPPRLAGTPDTSGFGASPGGPVEGEIAPPQGGTPRASVPNQQNPSQLRIQPQNERYSTGAPAGNVLQKRDISDQINSDPYAPNTINPVQDKWRAAQPLGPNNTYAQWYQASKNIDAARNPNNTYGPAEPEQQGAPLIQVWNGKTNKFEMTDAETYDRTMGKDPSTPVKIWNPDTQNWETVTTKYFNNNYNEIMEPSPTNTQLGGQKPTDSNGPDVAPSVTRFGIGQASAPQAADIARRGGEAARLSAEQSRAAEPRQAASGRQAGQHARAARARQARGRPARGRIPRRVYGPGHAGLGTYQELADGTAQYLGPQNLTG